MSEFGDYLAGRALYGDDFDPRQIADWYAAEREGYAGLGAADRTAYTYAYHALNAWHGFRKLPARRYPRALGLGSAYGDEFLPVLGAIDRLVISDPSASFEQDSVQGHPVEYVRPQPSGELPFADGAFDLLSCLGVLHHIPNVSFVLRELRRVLADDGFALVREPIVSMGDWRQPRRGLTRNERGIPFALFRRMILSAGFHIHHAGLCVFPPLNRLAACLGARPYNSAIWTRLDALCSALSAFNYRYHPLKVLHKFAPTSCYFVLEAGDRLNQHGAVESSRN